MLAFGGKERFRRPPLRPLVLLDSDGCVLNSMEIKQRTVFAPAFVSHFSLEAIAEEALEVWEFVSLHSRTRGANRFVLLLRAIDLLQNHPSDAAGRHTFPDLTVLRNEGGDTGQVTTSNLADLAKNHKTMEQVLAWSREIDQGVHNEISTVSPYDGVPDVIAAVARVASVAIVSQTPEKTLRKEWDHAGLLPYVDDIYGQFPGGKAAVLRNLTQNRKTASQENLNETAGPDRQILMVGDAPGDFEATMDTPVNFYPIIPGRERESWSRFVPDVLYPFVNGDYTDTMQDRHVEEFMAALQEEPSWKKF